MFGRFWGSGRGRRHKHCDRVQGICRRELGNISLAEAPLGQKFVIVCNPDRKTMEMGIYPGGIVTVQKNDSSDQNIVVAIGNSRYIIPRELARKIIIH
ncbi:MAG: ferrous iron transport protein A [Candidatus Cloacimonetes bacterium]|nr:ferrous iron transport protein A [Candidatus Cloacimonadota bacterium]